MPSAHEIFKNPFGAGNARRWDFPRGQHWCWDGQWNDEICPLVLRSVQVTLSEPGVCSDPAPAHPQPSLFKSQQEHSPQARNAASGGDREHVGLWLECFSYGKPRSCLCFWQLPCPLARAMQSLLLAPCPAISRAQLLFIDWVGLQELGEMHEEGWICHQTDVGSWFVCCFPTS